MSVNSLLLECCRAIVARENNAGSWVGGKIPDCMTQWMERHLPHVKDYILWLSVVESHIKSKAVEELVKQKGGDA